MRKILLLVCAFSVIACSQTSEKVSESAIIITNVNMVDVTDGSILENRHVIIDSGKIKKIVVDIENLQKYTTVIEAKGKYIIPGLAEMHAHIPNTSTSETRVNETLFLYLSNGITTIRGMLGHPSHLQARSI